VARKRNDADNRRERTEEREYKEKKESAAKRNFNKEIQAQRLSHRAVFSPILHILESFSL